MARRRNANPVPNQADEPAFLLSQVGAHSSFRFAERLAPLKLTPAHVGILRMIEQADGLSQQALGEKLGIFASRLVGLIDELSSRGYVERRDSPIDRRSYALYLTKGGHAVLRQVARVAREHQDALCAALAPSERAQLADLLRKIVAEQGLTPGVHPGYRKLGSPQEKGSGDS
jgi:DNA-binding MarR family transcriptional regulator